jgi:type II secretory pathway pseudopilin PulG
MRTRHGFTLAELAFTLVAVSGLAVVLTYQLMEARVRTQDRTVEQGLVQLAGDAARQASYGTGELTLDGFEDALALPTAPDMFATVLDGAVATPGTGVGPSTDVSEVSVLVSDDGAIAFLAARTFSGRCVLASVAQTGAVLVSRPQEAEVCLPRSEFTAAPVTAPIPVWSGSFTPVAEAGPAQATVGWSASGLEELPEGAPPVTLYVASAQRASGGASLSCSVFAEFPQNTTVAATPVEFACVIGGLTPDVVYNVRVVALSDAGQSLPSRFTQVTPTQLVVGDVDGEATTGQIVIEWGEDD